MKNFNSHLYELERVRQTVPHLRFNGDISLAEWQASAREKLKELLGLPLQRGESAFELERRDSFDGYTDYRFTVESEPGYFVPCHLLLPDGDKEKYPLTICFSGHGAGMHIALGRAKTEKDEKSLADWHHRAMGPRSIKEGRAALVIEARSFGECSVNGYGTSCTETAKTAILMGRTLIGERVHDAACALDAVLSNFPIDEGNIVATGNSGGGTAAYYFSALDERVSVCAPSCSICTFEGSIIAMEHCMCNHIPSIRRYFEMSDIAGLIAPRPLVIAAGRTDPIFPIAPTEECFASIQAIYDSVDSREKCALLIGEGGHLNYADLLWGKIHALGY